MSILGNIFGSGDVERKHQELQQLNERYIKEGDAIVADSRELYKLRKQSVKILLRVEDYVKKVNHCPQEISKGIERALKYTENFRNTIQWEQEGLQTQRLNSVNVKDGGNLNMAMGGISAGAAIATMGPTAAMAIATTFGTASTGVAISSLGGIAATNAALAWLGGGAIAAGGAGVVGGSALLALAGPIGWGIAGASVLGAYAKSKWKNSQLCEELNKAVNEINEKMATLEPKHKKLTRLKEETSRLNESVDLDVFLSCPNDFECNEFPKDELYDIVNRCKSIGKLINETVHMK